MIDEMIPILQPFPKFGQPLLWVQITEDIHDFIQNYNKMYKYKI